jgi:hypothetical protein
MFDPELFELTASQYRDFAMAMLTPTLAFLFLFLLALPLKKLPFLEAAEDYKPPGWVLPLFAIGSLFVCSFFFGVSLFMSQIRVSPIATDFLASYQKVRNVILPSNSKVVQASVVIEAYDGLSNFRVIANGYRAFSTGSNCRLDFQCKPANDAFAADRFKQFTALSLSAQSMLHLNALYSLPYKEDFSGLLVEGRNVIDVIAENSGAMTCSLAMSLVFELVGTSVKRSFVITPKSGGSAVTDRNPDHMTELFNSGGLPDLGEFLPVYRTSTANQSYRLCERLRFELNLTSEQVPDLVKDSSQLARWASKRFDRW